MLLLFETKKRVWANNIGGHLASGGFHLLFSNIKQYNKLAKTFMW